MVNLDKTDRTILCELDCNSRQSLSEIGKKVRLKKESVYYRIKQLEAKKIISGYPTIISLAKLGKIHAEMLLKFHNVTVALRKEMVDFFIKQDDIVYVTSCKGNWDIILGMVVKDINQLNSIKNRIFDAYSMYYAQSSISFTIETYFFGRKHLVGKHIHLTQHIDQQGDEKVGELDEKILKLISENSQISLLKMAQQLNTSPKVISYHVKTMEKNKIIQKYTLAVNMDSLNMVAFKLLIRLKNSDAKKRLVEYFHHQPNTVKVREVIADWNLEPTFEVSSPEEFYTIVHELEDKFGEHIMSHSSLLLDKEYKIRFYQ